MNRKAIIIGATGLVGEKLVSQLGYIYDKLIVIARSAPTCMSETMEFYHVKDFNTIAEVLESITIGADTDAFSCLGTTRKQAGGRDAFRQIDFGYNLKFAKACHLKGVNQFFLLSAMGADASSPVFYNQVKGELEAAIVDIGFSKLVIFQPSLLLGKHKGRPLETLTQQAYKMIAPVIPKSFSARPISADRVAAAMSMTAQDLYERSRFQNTTEDRHCDPIVTIIDNQAMLKMTRLKP